MDQQLMRVLMLSKACIVGIYQRKLEALAEQGVTLRVLVPPSWKDERGEQKLERLYTHGYDLQEVPIVLNGNFHLHFYPTLRREMQRFQPDIVHIDEEPYNLATWLALFHARRQQAKTLFFSWQNILRHYPPPFAWGERWVLDTIDYALVGTDSAGQVWRDKGYRGQLSTIPQFGTDLQHFQPQAHPERPLTIGYIGRMVEEKGIAILLEAVAKLQGEWRLRLVGGGTIIEQLHTQAQHLGIAERVVFVGQLPSTEIVQQYHQLDVLVLPSLTRPNWKEQFGRVLVEAMACELAVVGSDSGAIPSVIGDSGLIVPENNTVALTQALQSLLDNPNYCRELGQRGRQRALTHFTHDGIAQATVAVYQQMLSTKAIKGR
jgi:glycosyltransferase involved in cell wall biosynthesis